MKKEILFVDDNGIQREKYKKKIEDFGDYRVKVFSSASQVMAHIKNGKYYDMLICDAELDSRYEAQDVFDLSKEINPDVPTMVFSNYDGGYLSRYRVDIRQTKSATSVESLRVSLENYFKFNF